MNFDLITINSDIDKSVIGKVLKINKVTSERLVIILDTYGGSPFVAYRTMQHLNPLYTVIDIVVPDKAMSAGTLMCMGANTVYMYNGSSLGPLDLQIPHPSDGGQISTLDIRESTYDIFGLTTKVTQQLYFEAVDKMKLGKVTAAKLAHKSAVALLKPMVDKIDPFHLHASYRGSDIGQKYARILLLSRMMKANFQQAGETSKILAEDYEMHNYAITMEEARDYLRLNIMDINQLDVLSNIQPAIDTLPDGFTFKTIKVPSPVPALAPEKLVKTVATRK